MEINTNTTEIFYTEIEEDELFVENVKNQMIDWVGVVRDLPEGFDPNLLNLDLTAFERITKIYEHQIKTLGEGNVFFPGMSMSVDEGCQHAYQYAGANLMVFLKGSAVLNVIESLVHPFFTAWWGASRSPSKLISSLFQAFLKLLPNDYDFEFQLIEGMDQEQLIQHSLILPLAARLKEIDCNPYTLAIALMKGKERYKNTPYQKKIYAELIQIDGQMEGLHQAAIALFAFSKTVDKSSYLLRSLSNTDLIFSKKKSVLASHRDTFYIDLTPLINKSSKVINLALRSLLGDDLRYVFQGLSDNNLRILTIAPNRVADLSSFARALSFLTLGGRCHHKGWLKSTISALKEECEVKIISLSTVLKSQLFTQMVDHHKNEFAMFIALTFNVSAILYWNDPSDLWEIQKLWRLIISELTLTKIHASNNLVIPFVNNILTLMDEPDFNFLTLFYHIQIASHLDQHRYGPSTAHPTQNEKTLFTQWRIHFNLDRPDVVPICALFFPFDLFSSLRYLTKYETLPVHYHLFYEKIVNDETLCFQFGQSKLNKYGIDPRRNDKGCFIECLSFLNKKDETLWLIGFLMALTHLTIEFDSVAMDKLFESFLAMLKSDWAKVKTKQMAISLLCRSLDKSDIPISADIFQNIVENQISKNYIYPYCNLVFAFTSVKCAGLLPSAYEHLKYLDVFHDQIDYPTLCGLYGGLINSLIETISPHTLPLLVDVLAQIVQHKIFQSETKLKWFFECYEKLNEQILSNYDLENKLVDGILAACKSLKKFSPELLGPKGTKLAQKMLNASNRVKSPIKTMRLIKALEHFQIIKSGEVHFNELNEIYNFDPDNCSEEFISKLWNQTLDTINKKEPTTSEIDILLYLLSEYVDAKGSFKVAISMFNTLYKDFLGHFSVAQYAELCRILLIFQDKCGETNPVKVLGLLTAFSKGIKDKHLSNNLLNAIFNLSINPICCKDVPTQFYASFVKSLSTDSLQDLPSISQHSGAFLKILLKHQLEEEILIFYGLIPHPNLCLRIEDFNKVAIILYKKLPLFEELIEKIVLNLPPKERCDNDLLQTVANICKTQSLIYLKKEMFLESCPWLIREARYSVRTDANFHERAFMVIGKLIKLNQHDAINSLIPLLRNDKIYRKNWISICQKLLKHNQMEICLSYLKKNIEFLGLKNTTYRHEWKKILKKLISKSLEMVEENNLEIPASFFSVGEEIYTNCKLSKKLYLRYVDIVIAHGPLQMAENIFFILSHIRVSIP
jgi:hypothetical protein